MEHVGALFSIIWGVRGLEALFGGALELLFDCFPCMDVVVLSYIFILAFYAYYWATL